MVARLDPTLEIEFRPRANPLVGHQGAVNAVSVGGKLIASAGDDATARLWSIDGGNAVRTLSHPVALNAAALSPDGKILATGGWANTVFLWNAGSGAKADEFPTTSPVRALAFSPSGKQLAVGTGYELLLLDMDPVVRLRARLLPNHYMVSSVGFSADGKRLAACTYQKNVHRWDLATLTEMQAGGFPDELSSVAVSADGGRIAFASRAGNLYVWQPDQGRPPVRQETAKTCITTMAFLPGRDTFLYAGEWAGPLRLCDAVDGKTRPIASGVAKAINATSFAPDGRLLAAGCSDGSVRLWDVVPAEWTTDRGLLHFPAPNPSCRPLDREPSMDSPHRSSAEAGSLLEEISTRWSLITNPLQFVLRYSPAVRRYLGALVRNPHDAEDVAQTFLLRMVGRPFTPDRVAKGRFRDYLKAVLRNAAIDFFRQNGSHPTAGADLDAFAAPDAERAADLAWLGEWRSCLLERAWDGLDEHERGAPDSLAHTALRLAVDHPDEDSPALAARASTQTGRSLRPDAFRKQLSRARRRFAQLLVNEIRKTLERPGAAEVVEELSHLGLMEYVRDYLPETFRCRRDEDDSAAVRHFSPQTEIGSQPRRGTVLAMGAGQGISNLGGLRLLANCLRHRFRHGFTTQWGSGMTLKNWLCSRFAMWSSGRSNGQTAFRSGLCSRREAVRGWRSSRIAWFPIPAAPRAC